MTTRKIDWTTIAPVIGTLYPPPFDEPCRQRRRHKLGDAAGLTQFGVNLLVLPPGAWSTQRHWHAGQDEFIHVLEGEVTLVTDAGAELLRAGDSAGFKAGAPDGHCLQNRSSTEVRVLEVGTRGDDEADYPDIDLRASVKGKVARYTRRDGTPYADRPRRS